MLNLSDENAGKFEAQMEASGWRPVRDRFHNLHSWRHSETKKIVTNSDAMLYWWMSGKTPIEEN